MVSIIIPLYNVERYVESTLHSLFTQSYPDCEFIFIDDSSTDGTMMVVERFIESHYSHLSERIHIIHNATNRGVFESRMAGIKASHGDYICFVDGDDVCSSDMVKELLNASYAEEADMVVSHYQAYYGQGEYSMEMGEWHHSKERALATLLNQGGGFDNHLWAALYRKHLFDGVELLPRYGITLGEDMVMKSYALKRCNTLACAGVALYSYRVQRAGSYTTRSAQRTRSYMRAFVLSWQHIHPEGGYRGTWRYKLAKMNIGRWQRVRRGGHYPYRAMVYLLNLLFYSY